MAEGRGQAEQDFVDEYTRTLLVQWADHCIRHGSLPDFQLSMTPNKTAEALQMHAVYVTRAQEKGWLSSKSPLKVLAAGYKTAGAFLRR